MSIADELAGLGVRLIGMLSADDEALVRRAVEALRAGDKTAAILAAVRGDLDLRACAWCQHLHMRHHVCYRCGHDPGERPSAPPRKPLIGCPDCTWHGGYLMSHCEEHARPSAAERTDNELR